jgi:hypothetical protein
MTRRLALSQPEAAPGPNGPGPGPLAPPSASLSLAPAGLWVMTRSGRAAEWPSGILMTVTASVAYGFLLRDLPLCQCASVPLCSCSKLACIMMILRLDSYRAYALEANFELPAAWYYIVLLLVSYGFLGACALATNWPTCPSIRRVLRTPTAPTGN